MGKTIAIARREVLAYFATPVGYVVIALFLCITGFLFSFVVLQPGGPGSYRPFFDWTAAMLLFIAPAISMRLLAEELRLGTLESLMTCPVHDAQVIWGKWLGAMCFFIFMLVPTWIYVFILEIYADPDYGSIICGYVGLILVGGLYLAFGTLASTFWASQVLAYLVSLFFWLAFWGLTWVLPQHVPKPWSDALYWMSIFGRFANDFGKGVLDGSSIVYFASGTLLFLVIAVKALESRRWR